MFGTFWNDRVFFDLKDGQHEDGGIFGSTRPRPGLPGSRRWRRFAGAIRHRPSAGLASSAIYYWSNCRLSEAAACRTSATSRPMSVQWRMPWLVRTCSPRCSYSSAGHRWVVSAGSWSVATKRSKAITTSFLLWRRGPCRSATCWRRRWPCGRWTILPRQWPDRNSRATRLSNSGLAVNSHR